jgi:hypothetical protein
MSDHVPWVAQVIERDCQFERFKEVLETIADIEPHLSTMAPDQALPLLRQITRAACVALER